MLRARPAGAGSVVGPNRERVIGVGVPVVREQSFVVAERVGAGIDDDEARGLEIARFARGLERGQRGSRAIFRREIGGRIEVAVHRHVRLWRQSRHRFRIVGRELGQRLRLRDGASQRVVREIVGDRGGVLLSERALDTDRAIHDAARCRHLIGREADVRLVAGGQVHRDFVGLGHLHDFLYECVRLLARHHRTVGNERRRAIEKGFRPCGERRTHHAFLPVLITLMLRKRLGTQP